MWYLQTLLIRKSIFPKLTFIVPQMSSAVGSVSGFSILSHKLYVFLGLDEGTWFDYIVCPPCTLHCSSFSVLSCLFLFFWIDYIQLDDRFLKIHICSFPPQVKRPQFLQFLARTFRAIHDSVLFHKSCNLKMWHPEMKPQAWGDNDMIP